MKDTDHTVIGDSLHRLVKLAMDTGRAESLEEAQKLFMGYRLAVSVGEDTGHSQTLQAALLTIVNSARRSLLGHRGRGCCRDEPLGGDAALPVARKKRLPGWVAG